MKRFAKYLTHTITILAVLFALFFASYASDVAPLYLYHEGSTTNVTFANSVATCTLYVSFDTTTKNVVGTWKLEDLTTGTQVASWYVSKSSTVAATRTANAVKGHRYKVSFSGTAYGNDGGSETVTCSTTKTYN